MCRASHPPKKKTPDMYADARREMLGGVSEFETVMKRIGADQ